MDFPSAGCVLGIDPGAKRVGLAVSDREARVATSLPTFHAAHGRSLVAHLQGLCQEYAVVLVVVGDPVTLEGRPGAASRQARALARRLRRELQVPVELWDERLTSAQADRVLRGSAAPKGARDRVAATLILQSFLDWRAGKSE